MEKNEVGLLKQRIKDYQSCDKQLRKAYDLIHHQGDLLISYTNGLDEDSEVFQTIYRDIGEAIDHIYEAQEAIIHAVAAVGFTRRVAEDNLKKIINE
jgi:hypothetical protein